MALALSSPVKTTRRCSTSCRRRLARCAAAPENAPPGSPTLVEDAAPPADDAAAAASVVVDVKRRSKSARQASSTDAVASFLTRRFGLAGGLAWLGILTFGVVSEQLKTRGEVDAAQNGGRDVANAVEVTTPSGLRVTDTRLGGGDAPRRGDLVAIDVRVTTEDGTLVFDTAASGRQLAFFLGGRPLRGVLCPGLEEGVTGMRLGGRRRLIVAPSLGPPAGAALPGGSSVPQSAGALIYDVALLRVSAAPS